jgi:nucleotide-binding universal stress UspA family protein
MNTPRNAIVVGISADGYESALAYAVAEARRESRPLHLIHVLQLPAGEAYAGVYGGALETANATLADALVKAERLAGSDVEVTGEVIDNGWTVDGLVRGTMTDRVLVLQHRALSHVHRLFTGSTVQGVAGRSHVPVVSVPEGWSARSGTSAVVTAAVQNPVEAPALLRIAFEEARIRGARLVVLHAWWLASGYDVVVVDDTFRSEWTDRTNEEIEPVLEPLRAEFPEVDVIVEVRHAPPLEAILDAAEVSDLVVLGRRHHRLPLGSHLGPVTRGAVAHSTSPVLITPELVVATDAVPDPEYDDPDLAVPLATIQ